MDTKKVLVAVALLAGCLLAASVCIAGGDCCKKSKDGQCKAAAADTSKDPTAQSVVLDPACGMDVDAKDAKFSSEYKGKKYYFCSNSCKKKFDKAPSKFIGKGAK